MAVSMPNQRRREGDDPTKTYRRSQAPNYGIKRMIFVASMFFSLTGVKEPTRDQMNEVNQQFDLANRDQTLLFPAAISGIVWGKIDLSDYLQRYKENSGQVKALASELVAQAPFWVRYGQLENVAQDIKAVFDKVETA